MAAEMDDFDGFWSAVRTEVRAARINGMPRLAASLNVETFRKIVSGVVGDEVPLAELGIGGAVKEVLFALYESHKAKLDHELFVRLLQKEGLTVGQVKRSIAIAKTRLQNQKKPSRIDSRASKSGTERHIKQAQKPAVSSAPAETSHPPGGERATEGEESDIKIRTLRRRQRAFAGALTLVV